MLCLAVMARHVNSWSWISSRKRAGAGFNWPAGRRRV